MSFLGQQWGNTPQGNNGAEHVSGNLVINSNRLMDV